MAADRPLAERGIVEIKMGKSKFPGKPSKLGNRKRVNLSSCALPEENDSSKAAKNIYLGLSVFNETFGDNEMIAPGPFYGFSMAEVEDAMAEARLQQSEAEVEHKKQGIKVNFWESFQNELFSIISCSAGKNTNSENNFEKNKIKLSFDGGGFNKSKDFEVKTINTSDDQPSKTTGFKNSLLKEPKAVKIKKLNNFFNTTENKRTSSQFQSSRLKLSNLQCSSHLSKSLQSQAAKRLLNKAKTLESNKNNSADKKFILPSHSIRSSRVIKPNKRFLEETMARRKTLRCKFNCASDLKMVKLNSTDSLKTLNFKGSLNEIKTSLKYEDNKKKLSKSECVMDVKCGESKSCNESGKNSSDVSCTGKVILREARLQLDNSNTSLLEGPFSSPSASSLSPNGHLKVNLTQTITTPGSIACGVCGVVRFYKFVELAKKFGIYCCESCQKFISKIIKTYDVEKISKLQCINGKGICGVMPIVKSLNFSVEKNAKSFRCQACWLKLCLKNFKMPIKLKHKLIKLLPVNMQMGINLEINQILSNDITNKFILGTNSVKDFKWLNENINISHDGKSDLKDNFNIKQTNWSKDTKSSKTCLRKRNKVIESGDKSKQTVQNGILKMEADEKIRQAIPIKGPRVKHVCRSASLVLGQPLATFPFESGSIKKQINENAEDCRNCDMSTTTNICAESQEVIEKSNKIESLIDGKLEKKSKHLTNSKIPNAQPPNLASRPKRKANTKAENPISMDFWESYDPDEICETGFGLIGSEPFSVRALCFLCGSAGQERLIHCASCCEPYHEFCVDEAQLKLQGNSWKYDWVCPRCTVCFTCGRTSGQQLKCIKCDNSYHTECVDRVGGRLLHSPDRPWVCSVCLRCKSCNGVDVSVFVGNLPLCKACFVLRQKGNYCPLCQRCYEDDDYDSKMMECGQCKCWVHAKCEGLSDEKYQVLSFLPESVEYVCRMCCVMPPAPWWIAVEAELKSGYLGVLKALSKNRKACTMLKWSPRKQCSCRQVNFVSRSLDFEEIKLGKPVTDGKIENSILRNRDEKPAEQNSREKDEKYKPAEITERKASIEVINHPTESLKLTLKIMKGTENEEKEKLEMLSAAKEINQPKIISEKCYNKESLVRVKKCLLNEENSEDSLSNTFDCQEDSQTSLQSIFKGNAFNGSSSEVADKRSFSSPLNPPSDSGIGSTDDELKINCLTDEESCRLDDQFKVTGSVQMEAKCNGDTSVSFLEEKRECFCFLEVDSYNSRSKPFSPNLMSIKKKVTTSEYSSLHQFHHDMQGMIATTQSVELMELYHQTIKEIFPWFDPKFSRVQSSSQKVTETVSLESTPIKNTPTKDALLEECKIPKEKLYNQCLNYFYNDFIVEDKRMCLMCKTIGDGYPSDTGRLLYCGQNEWVHCNCALWSGEVFEEIDGSLQNVHSAISRGRSIRCPKCNLKGASIGCCARNCQETYHFSCARQIGCIFMDDKTVYCPIHVKESIGKLVQNEKDFEIRRPVYVELDKRKMKNADSGEIRFAVGALHVNSLGTFVMKLSDQEDAIIPGHFDCTRWFWSCFEPWRIVRYHFTVRLIEVEDDIGYDCGINLTIDHSKEPEIVEWKMKQLKHFQEHNMFLDFNEKLTEQNIKEKRKLSDSKAEDFSKVKFDETLKGTPIKKSKKDSKVVKKIFDQFDSKDEENCLSDNQNTADLLPPDLEEAIFKDLPHDILDGISMQDIFMDIKNDSYENNAKEVVVEDIEEDVLESSSNKLKKIDYHSASSGQVDFWNGIQDDSLSNSKIVKNLKRSKSDVILNQSTKKSANLKTYQKSCGLNCKAEGLNKWKKNSKCHVTVNLFEPQERGNMLQELKFTEGLVSISTGTIDSVKDFKARLEDSKQEGKENKCLPWHACLQPRLLQVDGGVDSSSSGSEAGESPQRLMDETMNSKPVTLSKSSSYFDSSSYSINSPVYMVPNSYSSAMESFSPNLCNFPENFKNSLHKSVNPLPQVDGISDLYSDSSDSENDFTGEDRLCKRPRREKLTKNIYNSRAFYFKINQCDGGIDSESDDNESSKGLFSRNLPPPLETPHTKDEPVKCHQCHCTYRTKISYERHLEACCSDFILSSSEEETSEEESLKKSEGFDQETKNEENLLTVSEKKVEADKTETCGSSISKQILSSVLPVSQTNPEIGEKLEVKKEKTIKRTYSRKKPAQNSKKQPVVNNFPQGQPILVQPQNATPTLIVQDIAAPNIMPSAFIDSGSAIGYVTAVESQNSFGKPQLIATPNGIISGNFQFPSAPETQILGGLCLNPQNMPPNIPGFIIQPPQPSGTLISSQPGSVMMSGDQMMLGHGGLYDVIQDPGTGRMILTSHNQPVFYNMETFVSNTVMQTNQFVSNFLATSYSQTSTQIFQAHEMEQLVNIPSNYIVIGSNSQTADKILSPDDLICVQAPQTLITNQAPIQIPNQAIFNQTLHTPQTFNAEHKIISNSISPLRCLQPLQVKQVYPSIILNKVTNTNSQVINQPVSQVFRPSEVNVTTNHQVSQIKVKSPNTNKISVTSQPKSVPMMRPSVINSSSKIFDKVNSPAKGKPQLVQPRSRALVDYINNFKSDICDTIPLKESIPNKKEKELQNYLTNSNCKSSSNLNEPSTFNLVSTHKDVQFALPSPVSKVSSTAEKNCLSVSAETQMNTFKASTFVSTVAPAKISPALNMSSMQESSPNNNLETLPVPKSIELRISQTEKNKTIEPQNQTQSIVNNMTNSKISDQEPNLKLSMPSLEDSSPTEVQQPILNSISTSPKSECQANEVLPLQENLKSINTLLKTSSKSPPKASLVKTPPLEEKKHKKRIISSDQNSLDSTLLLEKNQKKEENFLKKIKNGKFFTKCEDKGPKLIFDVTSDDGFKSSSTSMVELWANICDSVQEMRAVLKIPPLPVSRKGHEILGMQNHGLQHCLEQLRGVEQCVKYRCKYFIKEDNRKDDEDEVPVIKENLSGCARAEKFTTRKEYDMFAWLASKHRCLPKLTESAEETLSSIRRANSLPMAMRYRNLKETAKLYVGVYRSKIHGKGLFCLREIEAGEMVIEYAGEVIRSTLTDKREKYYTDKGIGCYMFRIDDHFVVDATMKGNAARFINHSCEPNCYSRVVDILGKKHIVIFALRKINIMEELTYDYKFPFEDEKISCHCLSKKCRKYLN